MNNYFKEELIIGERRCLCLYNENPQYLLIQGTDERDLVTVEDIFKALTAETGCQLMYVSYAVADWNRELSPWVAPAVFGKADFKGEAVSTLDWLKEQLIPAVCEKYNLSENIIKINGGYSLAGLFSLWSAYETDIFVAALGVSPSVWYPDFLNYAKENKPKSSVIYLSLGKKEPHTKNSVMAQVGKNITELYEFYKENPSVSSVILEWNEGNHFMDVKERMIKGFVWTLKTLKGQGK